MWFILGGGVASSKLSLEYFNRFDWKKINTDSIIICKQTKHHINVISTILHLFLFQKVQFLEYKNCTILMNIHYYSNRFLWQLYITTRIPRNSNNNFNNNKNDTTTWQLHNAMIYTGSYSASNIMLNYETWPNLKAVYRLIIIMNIQWYHGKIWFLKSKYWKYWHSHSVFTVDNFTFSKDNIFSSFVWNLIKL